MRMKIAAVLLAATMLTTPVLAASTVSNDTAPVVQKTTGKMMKTSHKKPHKHQIHSRVTHGSKAVRHARHVKPTHVKQVKTISKKPAAAADLKVDKKLSHATLNPIVKK